MANVETLIVLSIQPLSCFIASFHIDNSSSGRYYLANFKAE